MLEPILDAFGRTRFAKDVVDQLPGAGRTLRVGGLPGSAPALLTAALIRARPTQLIVIVGTTPAEAERWLTDLAQLTDRKVVLYPQREALGEEERHIEIAGERAETLEALLSGGLAILVTTARATPHAPR